MARATWNDGLKTGIGALDAEHRECCQLLDNVHNGVADGNADNRGGALLHALADRVRRHFSAEEAMMADDGYPGAVLHAMKHDHLTKQLSALIARVDRAPMNLDEHALKFLRDWFQTHIVQEDKAFGLWVNEHGKY